jgi:hypothetical protein
VSLAMKPERPLARIQLKGRAFLGMSEAAALEHVAGLLAGLGIVNPVFVPNRVDLRCDVFGETVERLVELPFVCQKMKRNLIYGTDGQIETIGYDTASLKIRIYDKVREIEQHEQKTEEYERANPEYTGGAITRIEGQFRKEALVNQFNVVSLDDLRQQMPRMVSAIMHHKLRFVRRSTATRIERCKTDLGWLEIMRKWLQNLEDFESKTIKIGGKIVKDETLWNVALGSLTSIAAKHGWTFAELSEQVFTKMNAESGRLRRSIKEKSKNRLEQVEANVEAIRKLEASSSDSSGSRVALEYLRVQMEQTELIRQESWPKSLDDVFMQEPDLEFTF